MSAADDSEGSATPPDDRVADPNQSVAPDAAGEQGDSGTGDSAAPAAALAAGALAAAIIAPAAPAAQAAGTAPGAAAAPTAAVVQTKKNKGPGAAKLAQMCGDQDTGLCRTPKWSEDHLTFDSVVIGRYVAATWPQIKMVGGWRPSDPYPDHPSGRAVDIMMPNGGSGKDKELGNEIAAYFQKHAREYGVEYILWRQQTWSVGDGPNGWTQMSDRGSPTANHMDHVHITVKGDKNTNARALIQALQGTTGQQATDQAGANSPAQRPPAQRMPIDTEATRTVIVELFDKPHS